jgi:Predicted redox protein, regulator of disulfide bond formation
MRGIQADPEELGIALVVDARGLNCPLPLLRIKKEIGKIKAGEILHILGTDPVSRKDFPIWCDRVGHEYLGEKKESDYLSFFIKKGR